MTRLERTTRRATSWLTFPFLLLTPACVALVLLAAGVTGFTTSVSMGCHLRLSSEPRRSPVRALPGSRLKFLSVVAGGVSVVVLPLAVVADPPLEKFTKGEVCLERNIVGTCSKFGVIDAPEEVETVSKTAGVAEPESELMSKLKRRTVENKARNDEEIATKTFTNGQSGEFGPFSRYIPVKHKDTGRYELVLISELDGMKKSGLIANERGQDVFVDAK